MKKSIVSFVSVFLLLAINAGASSSPIIWGNGCAYNLITQACVPTSGGGSSAWGSITGTLSNQTDLQSALNAKQATLSFTAPLVNTANTVAINGNVADNKLSFVNASDATKKLSCDLSSETASTTLTLTPQNTSNEVVHLPPVATSGGAAMALLQDETTGFIFSNGITSSLGGANSMMQLANATTANRAQIKLHSYFNGTSVAGVSTLTSRSGTIGTNSAVVAGQDYSKWTAQAGATTAGSAPISGAFAFKANTVNSLTVTSDFHLQLTNLAGTLADRFYLGSEGALQLPNYGTGLAHFDSSGNITSSAVNLASADATVQTSKLLYVDGNRSDSYTADGTISKPFKTIGAATSQVITNNDGALYVVYVYPGTYTESISLNNAAFTRIAFISSSNTNGMMSNDAIPITSLAGDITSTSNNDQLKAMIFRGFDIQGNINLTGASNGSNLCQYGCMFSSMMLYSTGAPAITLNNVGQVIFEHNGSAIQSGAGGVSLQNVGFFGVYTSFLNLGSVSIVTNSGANKPSGFSATSVQTSFGNLVGATTIDAGSSLVQRYERVSGTISNSGSMTSINSTYQSVVTQNSGASWSSNGDAMTALPVTTAITPSFNAYRFDKGHFLNGAAAATNAMLVINDTHLKSTQTTAPTATVNANAGTGATCTVANTTDLAGAVSLTTTAVSPASGAQCAINFNKTYNVAPQCVFSPANANSAQLAVSSGVYATSSTSALTFNFAVTDAIGHAYIENFHCVETQ